MSQTANTYQNLNHFADLVNSPRRNTELRDFLDQLHALSHRVSRRLADGAATKAEFEHSETILTGLKAAISVVQQARTARGK